MDSGTARVLEEAHPGQQDCMQQEGPGEPHDTWATLLKILFLIVINNNVRLHRDQLLLVKLPEVQECQLIKLLIAEQDLCRNSRR